MKGAPAAFPHLDHAATALARDGFVAIDTLFAPEDVAEAEILLDGLVRHLPDSVALTGYRGLAGDMRAADGDGGAAGQGASDQLEVNYAAEFEPRLLETRVFRQSAALARSLAGSVSRCFDHLIVKAPHNMSETPWHQDAAFFRFRAARRAMTFGQLHFWIPLQEVSSDNGCMEFIAGSHRAPLVPHHSFARQSLPPGFAAAEVDESRRIACPLGLGGLTIHTPYTLHHSGRNGSARPRKAWIIQFSRFGAVQLALRRMRGRIPAPLLQGEAAARQG